MDTQSNPTASCPLPIATTQLSRALLVLHARLRGELAKARTGEDLLVSSEQASSLLPHIEAIMSFLGTRFIESKLRPIRTRPKIGPLNFGDLRTEILAALRTSDTWMTYGELAGAIESKHQLQLSPPQRRHFLQKLREATHALGQQGAVEREHALKLGPQNTLQRWRLSQSLFRRA